MIESLKEFTLEQVTLKTVNNVVSQYKEAEPLL